MHALESQQVWIDSNSTLILAQRTDVTFLAMSREGETTALVSYSIIELYLC